MLKDDLGWDEAWQAEFDSHAEPKQIPARVAVQKAGFLTVFTSDGPMEAELLGRLKHKARTKSELPVVGDWVIVEKTSGEKKCRVAEVLPRRSYISRKIAGTKTEEQVMAANVDIVFIVTGLDEDFSLSRIERYVTLARDGGVKPVVVLNKADLNDQAEAIKDSVIEELNIKDVHTCCAEEKIPDALNAYLSRGNTIVLLGSSGVGKSTLINQFFGKEKQKVAETRHQDDKGRHTTTYRELFILDQGGIVIDSPGIREVQLWGAPGSVADPFADIQDLASNCKFRDCQHKSEPGCQVRLAVEDGTLTLARLERFIGLKGELEALQEKQEQQRWQRKN